MPRLKSWKLLTVSVSLCIIFYILSVSRSYQPLIVDINYINYNFIYTNSLTTTVPQTKYSYKQPSKLDTKKDVLYDFERDLKPHLRRKRRRIKSTKHTNYNYAVFQIIANKLWFMKNGQIRPDSTARNVSTMLWPNQDKGDRIVQQLMYVPANYKGWNISLSVKKNLLYSSGLQKPQNLKKIMLYFGANDWPGLPLGRRTFVQDKCPVNTCTIVNNLYKANLVDAVLFKNKFVMPKFKKPQHQVWILYLLESPLNTQSFRQFGNVINWTATYRRDSDIVTPYEKFVLYNVTSLYHPSENAAVQGNNSYATVQGNYSYATGKTKQVAWFVSNCNARNKRLQYAYELSHYINVDIYGACGINYCPRQFNKMCMERLVKTYKFYLAFENSNCKDYITEKFYNNGLGYNILPIVMGARRQDYAAVAPPHSFIHVDDFASPEELADYLHVLDANDTLYNEYFSWKGSGEFINTYFWCRLCALLHAPPEPKSYPDFHHWWAKPGTCDVRT